MPAWRKCSEDGSWCLLSSSSSEAGLSCPPPVTSPLPAPTVAEAGRALASTRNPQTDALSSQGFDSSYKTKSRVEQLLSEAMKMSGSFLPALTPSVQSLLCGKVAAASSSPAPVSPGRKERKCEGQGATRAPQLSQMPFRSHFWKPQAESPWITLAKISVQPPLTPRPWSSF